MKSEKIGQKIWVFSPSEGNPALNLPETSARPVTSSRHVERGNAKKRKTSSALSGRQAERPQEWYDSKPEDEKARAVLNQNWDPHPRKNMAQLLKGSHPGPQRAICRA